MDSQEQFLESHARHLLSGVLKDPNVLAMHSHEGGGNNKVFVLEREGIPEYIVKQYFRHPSDPRDRFRAEWAFLQYAMDAGVSCIPRPIACDPGRGIAIYEYVHGRSISAEDIRQDHIQQAMCFFEAINRERCTGNRICLQPAAEACFTLEDHVKSVERRIAKLVQMKIQASVDNEAYEFVKRELIPRWHNLKDRICVKYEKELHFPESLSDRDTSISPSDFGFHNAIMTETGKIVFIDFEYAGIDDPVKMICDFFCQPDVPVSHKYLPLFSSRILGMTEKPDYHYQRMELLFPLHTIKWCCIVLNEFLPVGRARRLFAKKNLDIEKRKEQQLKKAKKLFSRVDETIDIKG